VQATGTVAYLAATYLDRAEHSVISRAFNLDGRALVIMQGKGVSIAAC
jgi:hypothetical protein